MVDKYPYTNQYGVKFQKTVLLLAVPVKTSNLIMKTPHIQDTIYYVTLYILFYLKEAGCKGSCMRLSNCAMNN